MAGCIPAFFIGGTVMKRFVTLLAACLLLVHLAIPGFATEETEETTSRPANACGENLTWSYSGGTLTITGTGDMEDYPAGAPWDDYAGSITEIVLTGGVTKVGSDAFSGFTALKEVDFGDSLREIGENAFRGCTGLTSVSLPKSFRLFGPSCFQDCTNLEEVHCAGGMPSFRSNCLWNGSHITVFCPDDNVWSVKYVEELETNFGGRLEVLTESGKDVYTWPDETTVPTEPATQPATQPATEAPTVPTVPQTQPPVTEPATTAPEETTEATSAPTQPPQTEALEDSDQREPISGILVGTCILSGTLSLLLIGMLVFRASQKGGKYGK